MESKKAMLLEIIPKIKCYILDEKIKNKSYQDFIIRNKDLFICNLYNVNMVTEEDIKLLYLTIEQNLNISDEYLVSIFSYIGYKFEKSINEEQLSVDIYDKITGDTNYNMYNLFFSTFDFIIKHNNVKVLVHDENNNDVIINYKQRNGKEFTSMVSGQVVQEIPFNMKGLLSYVSKNLDQLRFSKKYLDFAYLCRNIGINISKKKFNVRYVFNYDADGIIIPIVITDYLDVKYVYLKETGKVYKNTFDDDNKYFTEWGKLILPKLNKPLHTYSYLFLSNLGLCDFFIELLSIKHETFKPKSLKEKEYVCVDEICSFWKTGANVTFIPCEHEIALINAKKLTIEYHKTMNDFILKYVYYENGIAFCKLCGINIKEFNAYANNNSKNASVPVMYNKSIFMVEPYSYFVHSQRFIFNMIMSFDTIMKSQTWSMKYNINRLIINFLISINNKRHEYEKRFANEIKQGVFFLRLSANLFDIQMSSVELFYSVKILNIHFIVALIIVLNNGGSFITSYMSSKKAEINDNCLNYTISVIIFDFLKKTRIADSKQFNTILLFTNTYMLIATDEMKAHYDKIKTEIDNLILIKKNKKSPNYDVSVYKDIYKKIDLFFFESHLVFSNILEPLIKNTFKRIDSAIIKRPLSTREESDEDKKKFDNITQQPTKVLIRFNHINVYNTVFFTTHIKIETEKKKNIIPLSNLLAVNVLKYYSSNNTFYLFKFGDPFPFHCTLINKHHLNYKINGYNLLRHALLPQSEVFTYYKDSLDRWEIEFSFYMFLSEYVNVTDWIEENSVKIKDLYMLNFNN